MPLKTHLLFSSLVLDLVHYVRVIYFSNLQIDRQQHSLLLVFFVSQKYFFKTNSVTPVVVASTESVGSSQLAVGANASTNVNQQSSTHNLVVAENNSLNNTVTQTSGILTANLSGATYQWYTCPNTLLTGEIKKILIGVLTVLKSVYFFY